MVGKTPAEEGLGDTSLFIVKSFSLLVVFGIFIICVSGISGHFALLSLRVVIWGFLITMVQKSVFYFIAGNM